MADDTVNRGAYNRAYEAALKLRAMLAVTWGDQGETFREMSNELQDCFMWACFDHAVIISEAIDAIPAEDRERRKAAINAA